MDYLRIKNWCGRLLAVWCMLCVCASFSSCKDDDDEGGGSSLAGYWLKKDRLSDYLASQNLDDDAVWYGDGQFAYLNEAGMYHFINDNTVEVGLANVYKTSQGNSMYTERIQGHQLYFVWNSIATYTYVRQDNKIIVTNGDILTVSGGSLYKDGESGAYEKVKEN